MDKRTDAKAYKDETKTKMDRITVTFAKDRTYIAELPTRHEDNKNVTKKRPKIDKTSLKEVQQWLLKAKAELAAEKDTASETPTRKVKKNTKRAQNRNKRGKTYRPEFSKPKFGTSKMQLENLDTTKVTLGDSQRSKSAMLGEWDMIGTMSKILNCIKMGVKPLNIKCLVSEDPSVPGFHPIIRTRCITSVLQLKERGYIKLNKDPTTLEIDIELGPNYDSLY